MKVELPDEIENVSSPDFAVSAADTWRMCKGNLIMSRRRLTYRR